MEKQFHPYHMVEKSPWPLSGALGGFMMVLGLVKIFNVNVLDLFFLGGLIVLLTMIFWWRDVVRESTYQGWHSFKVVSTMKIGMVMFITSEVLFFFSFFWAFFHSSLTPSSELGLVWPPVGLQGFNPFGIPLLGTSVLLGSGVSVTWAHHSLMGGNYFQSLFSMGLTILFGLVFTYLQSREYYEASFNISDSVYSSTFFVATGFHGLHVIIGSTFLFVCFFRMIFKHVSMFHHVGFEAAAWYWHFVDVVWLFLFVSIYWWGS